MRCTANPGAALDNRVKCGARCRAPEWNMNKNVNLSDGAAHYPAARLTSYTQAHTHMRALGDKPFSV